jgi:hypothetical protein
MNSLFIYSAGFGSGWFARSLANTPEGVGGRLLETAYRAKERFGHWALSEYERLEDMWAEVRSRVEQEDAQVQTRAAEHGVPGDQVAS